MASLTMKYMENMIAEKRLEIEDTILLRVDDILISSGLEIFENKEISNCTNGDFKHCAAINRLCVALKFYSTLNVIDNDNDQELFRSFIHEKYRQIVNDNNHFMTVHSEQLEEIYKWGFNTKCNVINCKFTNRHFESEWKINVQGDQPIIFYIDLMDSLHFIICHCYDSGYRVERNANKRIIQRMPKLKSISPAKLVVAQTEKGFTTFLDELFKHLNSELPRTHIRKFLEVANREEYDSESIKMDVFVYGNIAHSVNNKDCLQSIEHFINAINVQSNTFSVGLRFYYWQYYQQRDEIEEQIWNNKHDHGGYKVSDLCIDPKYDSFKGEAMNYPNFTPNFTIDEYKSAYAKATIFMKHSDRIKVMSAKYTDGYNMLLHYDIAFGDSILFVHIFALILYTDYSNLHDVFCSTFRQMHKFETLKSIKTRNALFYWMSRRLRELVELFGQCSYGDTFDGWNENRPLDAMRGPFYYGTPSKMNLDSSVIRLNAPTSTSKTFRVAALFAGTEGIVFTFDNPRTDVQYRYLRCFNCSHVSRYKEENERLFFGGFYRIKVVNVRLMHKRGKQTKQTATAMAVFTKFDQFLTGSSSELSEKECIIIGAVIKVVLNNEQTKVILPQYVLDSFRSFCTGKRQIILNMRRLNKSGNQRINKLLFHSLEARRSTGPVPRNGLRSVGDLSNVFRSDVISVFPNVTSLTVQNKDLKHSFSVSLESFLEEIWKTNLTKVIIKSVADIGSGYCWLTHSEISPKEIEQMYAAKGYDVSLKEVIENNSQMTEYWLVIKKEISFHLCDQ